MNYDAPDERWPAALKASFEQYMTNGGGLVAVHAADNAFPGLAGVQRDDRRRRLARAHASRRGRTGSSSDGKLASDRARAGRQPRPPRAVPDHGARQLASDHEGASAGLDAPGRRALRAAARPGRNMTVLATAFSDPQNNGSGRDEPMLMVLSLRQGPRLPHDARPRRQRAQLRGFRRHAAARNRMGGDRASHAEGPGNFPTADTVAYRADLAAMDPNFTNGLDGLTARPDDEAPRGRRNRRSACCLAGSSAPRTQRTATSCGCAISASRTPRCCKQYSAAIDVLLVAGGDRPLRGPTAAELARGLRGLLGTDVRPRPGRDGRRRRDRRHRRSRRSSPRSASTRTCETLGGEGYIVRSDAASRGRRAIVIAANTEVGVLYGAFHLLRLLQTHQRDRRARDRRAAADPAPHPQSLGQPRRQRRARLRRRLALGLAQAARTTPRRATPTTRAPTRRSASTARCSRTSTPTPRASPPSTCEGGRAGRRVPPVRHPRLPHRALQRADRDRRAQDGRSARARGQGVVGAKVDEIYKVIPDFGGFLVKANSEGQPGPQDYKRTHADGANMLADALAPHGGIVMWRAFVYSENVEGGPPRAGVQRVPAARRHVPPERAGAGEERRRSTSSRASRSHPLFGAMPKTPLMLELQITKEYLGFATHLVYLGAAVRGGARADTPRERRGLARARGDRRIAARLRADRHRRRRQHRHRSQLVRRRSSPAPTGTRSAAWRGTRRSSSADARRRVAAHDVHERPRRSSRR